MTLNKKNKLIIFSCLIGLIAVYQLAIKKTLFYRNEYLILKNEENSFYNIEGNEFDLRNRHKRIEDLLQKFDYRAETSNNKNFQNYLFKFINEKTNSLGLQLVIFKEPKTTQENTNIITHYNFSVEGSYNQTLLLINEFDNNPIVGNLIHIETIKKTDYKLQKSIIITNFVLRKIAY